MILPYYIHCIYIPCIIYRLWRWHFKSYFLFALTRIQNWQKIEPIWRKIQKKVELRGVRRARFFQVCFTYPQWLILTAVTVQYNIEEKVAWSYLYIYSLSRNIKIKLMVLISPKQGILAFLKIIMIFFTNYAHLWTLNWLLTASLILSLILRHYILNTKTEEPWKFFML